MTRERNKMEPPVISGNRSYSIAEISRISGLTESTIRYYEQEGLLTSVPRDDSGRRTFQSHHLYALALIRCLKDTGMGIRDIARFMRLSAQGDETLPQRSEIMRKQRETLLRKREEIDRYIEMIDHKLWFYETAQQVGSENVAKLQRQHPRPLYFKPTPDSNAK